MASLTERLGRHATLSSADERWLVSLVNEWQLWADLSFSDLVLWVADSDPSVWWAVAQTRPATGPTALESDVVGESLAYEFEEAVLIAGETGEVCTLSENRRQAGIPVDLMAVPVVRAGRTIAVVECHTNRMGVRMPGELEDGYRDAAALITGMVHRAEFPISGQAFNQETSPRVGDGVIRVDAQGTVLQATPNAITCYRRLGLSSHPLHENLPALTERLAGPPSEPVGETWQTLFLPSEVTEFGIEGVRGAVRLRVLPLRTVSGGAGAVVLCRDVTELAQLDRKLVSKNATIREIHHRVKNNLQTVAALLRMQGRRMTQPEARDALNEAMQRVAAIAVVHETLSQSFDEVVDFDEVADRVLRMAATVSITMDTTGVRTERRGSFGPVPAQVATNLSLVVTELVQNAVEHGGHGGKSDVVMNVTRTGDLVRVEVTDDGVGLPEGFDVANTGSLGLSIVRTLVEEMGGSFALRNRTDDHGVVAELTVRL